MADYSGKYFSVVGDSISTLRGFNPEGYAVYYQGNESLATGVYLYRHTWWGQVIDALGGELLVNNSFSGSLVCRMPGCGIPSYSCSDERCSSLGRDGISPDVIMIYMGTNDRGWGVRTEPEAGDGGRDLSVFRTAYAAMLDKISRNYPDAGIWCLTLGVSRCGGNPDFVFRDTPWGGRTAEYNCVIADCAAAEHLPHCRLIDLSAQSEPFDTCDGVHPTAGGMATLAGNVLGIIRGDAFSD